MKHSQNTLVMKHSQNTLVMKHSQNTLVMKHSCYETLSEHSCYETLSEHSCYEALSAHSFQKFISILLNTQLTECLCLALCAHRADVVLVFGAVRTQLTECLCLALCAHSWRSACVWRCAHTQLTECLCLALCAHTADGVLVFGAVRTRRVSGWRRWRREWSCSPPRVGPWSAASSAPSGGPCASPASLPSPTSWGTTPGEPCRSRSVPRHASSSSWSCESCDVSLAGPATSHFCKLVATKLCLSRFVATKMCLLRQNFCRDKHTFVATKDVFCRDKHVIVATKMIVVAVPANDSYGPAQGPHVVNPAHRPVSASHWLIAFIITSTLSRTSSVPICVSVDMLS